jgi:hypothetical protein
VIKKGTHMKVLSLIQPWATLIVLGEKKIETRSWRPKNFSGELFIHASKKIDKKACESEPFKSVLAKHGYTVDNLPLGAIIGKCDVLYYSSTEELRVRISEQEEAFGDYSDNRYGWTVDNPMVLVSPIPARGSLIIWNYE